MDEQFIKAETLARTLAALRPPEPATDEALPVEEADWQASSFLADLLIASEPEAPPLDRTTVFRLAGHGKGAADRWSEALRSLEAKYVIRYVLGKLRVPHGVRIAAIKSNFGDLRAEEVETLKKILDALPALERAKRTISKSSFRELAGRYRAAHRTMPDDRALMSLIGIEAHGRRLEFSAGRGSREVWTRLASKIAALSWQRIFKEVRHVTVDSLRRWLGLVDPLDFWGRAPTEMSRDARDRFLDLVLEALLDEPDLQGGWGTERLRIQRELDDPWSEPHIPVPDEGVRSLADLHDWVESRRVFEHIRWSARDELDGLLYSLLATDSATGAYRNRCARIAQLSQAAAGIPHLAVNLHWQIKRHRPEALAWLLARIDTSAFALILLSNHQIPIQDAWDDFSGRFAAQQEGRLGVWRQSLRVYWASLRSASDNQQRAQAVSEVLRTLVLQRIWPGPIQPQLAALASETAITQLALFQTGLATEPANSGHPRPLLLSSVVEPVTAALRDAFRRSARFEHAAAPKLHAWSTLLAATEASDPDSRQLHRDVQKRLAGEILGTYLTLIREAAGATPDATGKMPIVHWHDDEPFVAALNWGNVARHLDAEALNSLLQPVNFLAVSKDIPVKARDVRDPHVRIDDEVAWAAHVLTETWARKARLHLRVLLALFDAADEIETLGANTVRRWILDLARLHGPGVPEKGGLPIFRPSPVGFLNQADELSGLVLKAVVGLPTDERIRGLEAWISTTIDLGLLLELARFDQPGETRSLILNHIATIDLDKYLKGEEWIQNVERAADAAALLGASSLAERILSYGEKEFTGRPHWDDFAYRFRLRMAFQRKEYEALKSMPAPATDDQARSAELQEAKEFFESVSLFETDPTQAARRLKDLLLRRPSAYLAVNVLAARIGAADRESGAARFRLLREALQEWDDVAAQIPDAQRAEIQLVAAAHRLAINDRLGNDSAFDEIWVSLPKEHQFSEQFLPLRVANLLRRQLVNDAKGLVDTAAAYHGYSTNP